MRLPLPTGHLLPLVSRALVSLCWLSSLFLRSTGHWGPSLGLVQKPLGLPTSGWGVTSPPRCVLKKLSRLPRLPEGVSTGLRARAPRTTGLPLLAVHLSPESPDLGLLGPRPQPLPGPQLSLWPSASHRAHDPPPVAQNQCSLCVPCRSSKFISSP